MLKVYLAITSATLLSVYYVKNTLESDANNVALAQYIIHTQENLIENCYAKALQGIPDRKLLFVGDPLDGNEDLNNERTIEFMAQNESTLSKILQFATEHIEEFAVIRG